MKKVIDLHAIGQRISSNWTTDKKGLTQKEIAARMDCEPDHVSKVMSGTKNPSIEFAYQYSLMRDDVTLFDLMIDTFLRDDASITESPELNNVYSDLNDLNRTKLLEYALKLRELQEIEETIPNQSQTKNNTK